MDNRILPKEEEWVAALKANLPVITDQDSLGAIDNLVRRKYRAGWALEDVIAYCFCTEIFSPEIPEQDAFDRMEKLDELDKDGREKRHHLRKRGLG